MHMGKSSKCVLFCCVWTPIPDCCRLTGIHHPMLMHLCMNFKCFGEFEDTIMGYVWHGIEKLLLFLITASLWASLFGPMSNAQNYGYDTLNWRNGDNNNVCSWEGTRFGCSYLNIFRFHVFSAGNRILHS